MVLMPLTLLVMGVPIFLLLLATCITAVVFFTSMPHVVVHQVVFDSLNKFPLIAVPFFIFTGDLMSHGGQCRRKGAHYIGEASCLGKRDALRSDK